MSNFFFIGTCSWVDIAHEESGRYSAGEIGLIAGESHDLFKTMLTKGMM